MRLFTTIAAGSIAIAAAASSATTNDPIAAPVRQFIDAFNKNDVKAAEATHAADVSIIDEVPPYSWRGPGAFKAWVGDLMANDKKAGISGEMVALSAPIRFETAGDRAYVVCPAVYHFKQHGLAMSEPARMTFVEQKSAAGWKIIAWTWTGPKPTVAK